MSTTRGPSEAGITEGQTGPGITSNPVPSLPHRGPINSGRGQPVTFSTITYATALSQQPEPPLSPELEAVMARIEKAMMERLKVTEVVLYHALLDPPPLKLEPIPFSYEAFRPFDGIRGYRFTYDGT